MESDGATLLVGTWQLYLFVPVFHVAIFLPGFLFLDHAGADGGPQTTAKIDCVAVYDTGGTCWNTRELKHRRS